MVNRNPRQAHGPQKLSQLATYLPARPHRINPGLSERSALSEFRHAATGHSLPLLHLLCWVHTFPLDVCDCPVCPALITVTNGASVSQCTDSYLLTQLVSQLRPFVWTDGFHIWSFLFSHSNGF